MRDIVFRHHQQAGSFFVNAMDYAGAYAASRARKLIEVINQRIGQRPRLDARARMHDHTGGLIDNYHIIIFEDDIERNRFGRDFYSGRLGQIDLYRVSGSKAIARFDRAIID